MKNQLSETEFENLIYENQELIIKVCNIYCRTIPDRDDLFQDITVNLWKGISSFKGEAKISTWIYRVSINTAISRIRKTKKENFVDIEQIPDIHTANYEQESDEQLRINALYFAIDKLKPVEKALILLYLEEYSYDDIAKIMGMTNKNVSVKLVRIKKKLADIIKPILK